MTGKYPIRERKFVFGALQHRYKSINGSVDMDSQPLGPKPAFRVHLDSRLRNRV
jgi:hypothetical protein